MISTAAVVVRKDKWCFLQHAFILGSAEALSKRDSRSLAGPWLAEAPANHGEALGKSVLVSPDCNISSFSMTSFIFSCQSFSSAFLSHIVKLLKKVISIGDTSCLLPIMDIFRDEDRKLMQTHCHFRALTILKDKQEEADVKEAIAYLSFAIIASGRITKILIEDLLLWEIRSVGRQARPTNSHLSFPQWEDWNSRLTEAGEEGGKLCLK